MTTNELREAVDLVFSIRAETVGDIDVIDEVVNGDCYRLREVAAGGFCPQTVLDIGAHIGTFSKLAQSIWPNAKIYCLEPNKRSFELLLLNVPSAVCLNAAIRYDSANILTDGEGATGGGFMTTHETFAEVEASKSRADHFTYSVKEENVTLLTIEQVISLLGVDHFDLVKFDCEGSEIDCFENITKDAASRLRLILGEYHTDKGFNWFKKLADRTFPHLKIYGGNGKAIGPFWSRVRRFAEDSTSDQPNEFRTATCHHRNLHGMFTRKYEARVFTHDRGDFRNLRNSNVLIYFPHGFGDWVQFSYIVPFLDESNRYWMTRFGDDNVAVMDNHETIVPVYMGSHSAHNNDGGRYNNRHFRLDYNSIDGTVRQLHIPLSLHEVCCANQIESILWTDFPERHGNTAFPYHTKPRHLIPFFTISDSPYDRDLSVPLKSTINFETSAWASRWVENRLRNFAGYSDHKICVICRNGYTATGKNWGHLFREELPEGCRREGQECRDFISLLRRKDPKWMFIVIEDQFFEGDDTVRDPAQNSISYSELFGTPECGALPFGIVMKALLNLADLSVGVPAGPYHLSMAKSDLPTIGLWIEHLPSWYDEPKPNSIHIISRNMAERDDFGKRPGSFLQHEGLEFRNLPSPQRVISGQLVMDAAELLLY